MKNLFVAVLLLSSFIHSSAKDDPKYPVKDLPDSLTKGMYAVYRNNDFVFEILGKDRSIYKHHYAITILNPKAKDYAFVQVGYDKLTKIETFKGAIYDAEGNVVRKLKSSDIIDQSAISGATLFDDSRVKYADLTHSAYPYTVEIEYEVSFKFLYGIPTFELYEDDEVSIQNVTHSIVYPLGSKPNYRCLQIPEPNITTPTSGKEALVWSFKNVIPKKFEQFSPASSSFIPTVLASPKEFVYEGYYGKLDSWDELGKFQVQLNIGRDVLPQSTIETVKEITKNAKNDEEKIKIIYQFLQAKTRYVSIQRGIGGFQPFDAMTVDRLGYGDCKALSNYMVALLKHVGIKGYYTQVYGDDVNRPFKTDFPIDNFNHIIVSVPNNRDTVWLECTSQTQPFGFLGSFTSDRYALMITETGGVLVKTPAYSKMKNLQSRVANVTVDKTGHAKASVKTTYSGLQYEKGNLNYVLDNRENLKKWIEKNTSIPSFEILSYSSEHTKSKIPSASLNVEFSLNRFASVSGKRIFLTPNLLNRSSFIPERLEKRNTPIDFRLNLEDVDSIVYSLPEEIYPEYLPEPVKLKSKFGEYEASFKIDQGSLIYIRKNRIYKGQYAPESYQELIDHFKSINKADNVKMVFLSKT